MKTEEKSPSHTTTTTTRKSLFSLRSRKKKDGVIQGRLRIRSMPGAFLVLGVVVVVVGTALAVAGYWPYRTTTRTTILDSGGGMSAAHQASGLSMGAKGLQLSTASLVHSERMKLLGPVIMGVGLFILICANTVLYENRDRETQMLVAQMRSVICSVSAAVPGADLTEIAVSNAMARHYQFVSSLPAAHLNILCLKQMTSASSEPSLRTRDQEEERRSDGTYQQAVLMRTEALHHQESVSPPRSVHSSHSNSCNSSKTDFNTRCSGAAEEPGGEGSPGLEEPPPAHLFKLNNCLVSASSMSTLGGDDWEVPAAVQPRRCHSLSYRTKPHRLHGLESSGGPGTEGQTVGSGRDPGSQVCVNVPGQAAEPLGQSSAEEQMYCSWPRLELQGYARRYLKLENKEDSVDKLLDQMEQQCSQWDRSFGSGPFQ